MVDELCFCLRGVWQECCSRRTPSALSCRDQGSQEDSPPFESALRNSSGGKAVNIEHYSYLMIVTSWFFFRQNTIVRYMLITLEESPLISQRASEQSAELPARLVPEMSRETSLGFIQITQITEILHSNVLSLC